MRKKICFVRGRFAQETGIAPQFSALVKYFCMHNIDIYHKQIRYSLQEQKFVIMSNAMPLDRCQYFVDRMFDLKQQGLLHRDPQCPLSDSAYHNPLFDPLHREFAHSLGVILGVTLLPTFTYCRIYRKGEILQPHTDRAACEITVSLTLGSKSSTAWPLFFNDQDPEPVELAVGEMVLYLGREITHWRERFQGDWQVQLSLHYVIEGGEFANHSQDSEHAKSLTALKAQVAKSSLEDSAMDLERVANVVESILGSNSITNDIRLIADRLNSLPNR